MSDAATTTTEPTNPDAIADDFEAEAELDDPVED
jgi:hypothetical protein